MNLSLWGILWPQAQASLSRFGSKRQSPVHSGQPASLRDRPDASLETVQRLVAGLCQATQDAAEEVRTHRTRVSALSDELDAASMQNPVVLAALVRKLLEVNTQLAERLSRAEQTIQAHHRELHTTTQAARTDALTGLSNRRVLEAYLKRALRQSERGQPSATLFLLDLDHFKALNDRYGHMAGDEVLRQVAQTLRRHAKGALLVARYGGEEFAILYPGSSEQVAERAEALRQAIGQAPLKLDGEPFRVTASGGLAEAAGSDSVTQWIERADQALYAAKRQGRNRAFQYRPDGTLHPLGSNVMPGCGERGEEVSDRGLQGAEADLTSEAFADPTFPEQIARRIAEWRRGGPTLTVVLFRWTGGHPLASATPSPEQMRKVFDLAKSRLRAMDVLTRWQQDGLALLLPGMEAREARKLVWRLIQALGGIRGADGNTPSSGGLRAGIAEGLEGNDARRVLERAWLAVMASLHDPEGRAWVHDGVRTRPLTATVRPGTLR